MNSQEPNPSKTIVIATTASGTLYIAIPKGNAMYQIHRCRENGLHRRGLQQVEFEGLVVSVQPIDKANPRKEDLVACGSRAYQIVPGTWGRPKVGFRMGVGGSGRGVKELTSRVTWTATMDIERANFTGLIVKAFRSGARERDWKLLTRTQPAIEGGDEHIEDFTGAIRALSRCYTSYLEHLAAERDTRFTKFGHECLPVSKVLSNEDMDDERELNRVCNGLVGDGMNRLGSLAQRKHRHEIDNSLDRALAWIDQMGATDTALPKAA